MEREEERERRRLRDRERRQSMTKEERARHLARRRRNYQLRRQRAAAAFMSESLPQTVKGSSIQLEGCPKRLRLNIVKQLARNLASVTPGNHQVAPELISASTANGNTSKPLRLNRVKRLARSLSISSEKTAPQKNHNHTEVNGESLHVVTS
ncbi:hypothetical protein Fmac_013706 [Flemingia macrophylla]|uniref:Uncharacterized protein n=1 Tax=Flemingia macrophylla TaxID=520843 RepID=A0ABD1MW54_9FABA